MGLSDAQEVYNLLEGKRIPVLYRNGKADRVGIWKVLTDTYKTRGRSCYENGVLCFSSLSPQPSTSVTGSKGGWSMTELKKVGDLEKLRERFLPKEFENYRTSSQKWLNVFRLEAVRAGFKKAWQERDYATIITVARKVPENVLQEDPKLLMWYDQALTRFGEG